MEGCNVMCAAEHHTVLSCAVGSAPGVGLAVLLE